MKFVFRLPRFPVIIDSGQRLILAKSKAELVKVIQRLDIDDETTRDIIDCTGEGFAFYPKIDTVTPSIGIRRWKKLQIIDLYDARRHPEFPVIRRTSLGNRTLEDIVKEVVELLLREK